MNVIFKYLKYRNRASDIPYWGEKSGYNAKEDAEVLKKNCRRKTVVEEIVQKRYRRRS